MPHGVLGSADPGQLPAQVGHPALVVHRAEGAQRLTRDGHSGLGRWVHLTVSSRAIGLFIAGNAIDGLTGRLLGGFLTDLGGWRLALGGVAVLRPRACGVFQVPRSGLSAAES